jgi:hypothetical protein
MINPAVTGIRPACTVRRHDAQRKRYHRLAVKNVSAERQHDRHRRRHHPEESSGRAGHAVEPRAERDREVKDVAARQELAQAHHVGELGWRQPSPLLDHHAARPGQRAAEAAHADRQEAEEQTGDARWDWRVWHAASILDVSRPRRERC